MHFVKIKRYRVKVKYINWLILVFDQWIILYAIWLSEAIFECKYSVKFYNCSNILFSVHPTFKCSCKAKKQCSNWCSLCKVITRIILLELGFCCYFVVLKKIQPNIFDKFWKRHWNMTKIFCTLFYSISLPLINRFNSLRCTISCNNVYIHMQ